MSFDTTIELKKLLGLMACLTLRDQNGDAVVRTGSFIKIDNDITLGTSGALLIKAASMAMSGAATITRSPSTMARYYPAHWTRRVKPKH